MLAKLLIAVMLLVIVGLIALRFARTNSIERSISGHKRRLGSIEEIVHRSAELNARERSVRPSKRADAETPDSPPAKTPAERTARRVVPEARAEIEVPGDRRVSDEGRLVFGDLSVTPVVPPVPPIYGRRPRRERKAPTTGTHFRGSRKSASKTPLYAAMIALVVVIGGGAAYAIHRGLHHSPGASVTTTTQPTVRTTVPSSNHQHHTAPKSLNLVHLTSSSATYVAPVGNYRIDVTVTGPCWLGFEHELTGTPWLATPTIGVGGVFSFAFSTHGHLVLVVGATANLRHVVVNGTSLALPRLPSHAFDLIFS